MKIPFWRDPNETIEILDPTVETMDEYGHGFGSDLVVLLPEHVEALKDGAILAWNDSEYTTFVIRGDSDFMAEMQRAQAEAEARAKEIRRNQPLDPRLRRFGKIEFTIGDSEAETDG